MQKVEMIDTISEIVDELEWMKQELQDILSNVMAETTSYNKGDKCVYISSRGKIVEEPYCAALEMATDLSDDTTFHVIEIDGVPNIALIYYNTDNMDLINRRNLVRSGYIAHRVDGYWFGLTDEEVPIVIDALAKRYSNIDITYGGILFGGEQ